MPVLQNVWAGYEDLKPLSRDKLVQPTTIEYAFKCNGKFAIQTFAMADNTLNRQLQMKNRKRWVIVFACFLAKFACGMIVYAMPFVYQEHLTRFGQSAAVTSGPLSLFKGLGYFLGK